MEDKELIEFRSKKPHNSKEILEQLWKSGKTVNEISKLLHISTKLVHIKLKEHSIF